MLGLRDAAAPPLNLRLAVKSRLKSFHRKTTYMPTNIQDKLFIVIQTPSVNTVIASLFHHNSMVQMSQFVVITKVHRPLNI